MDTGIPAPTGLVKSPGICTPHAPPEPPAALPHLAPRQSGRSLRQDLLVGLSGAILALPQSIAYALIAGLPAEYGLYAAIVPVLVACLWGSSGT